MSVKDENFPRAQLEFSGVGWWSFASVARRYAAGHAGSRGAGGGEGGQGHWPGSGGTRHRGLGTGSEQVEAFSGARAPFFVFILSCSVECSGKVFFVFGFYVFHRFFGEGALFTSAEGVMFSDTGLTEMRSLRLSAPAQSKIAVFGPQGWHS